MLYGYITDEGIIVTTSYGEKCGKKLKKFDGKEYVAVEAPAKAYCK